MKSRSNSSRNTVCSEVSEKIPSYIVNIPNLSLKNICCMCKSNSRQQVDPEERRLTSMDQFHERLYQDQRSQYRQVQKESTRETDSRPSSESESGWAMEGKDLAQSSEPHHLVSLPIHEHWIDLDSPVERQSDASKLSDMSSGDCKEIDAPGISCEQNPSDLTSPVKVLDSASCFHNSTTRTLMYQPVTDREWIKIFKPTQGEVGAGCRGFANSPQATPGIKSSTSKRFVSKS